MSTEDETNEVKLRFGGHAVADPIEPPPEPPAVTVEVLRNYLDHLPDDWRVFVRVGLEDVPVRFTSVRDPENRTMSMCIPGSQIEIQAKARPA